MTTKPILFSGPMVRALLEGRKTQTRRLLKPQPELRNGAWFWRHPKYDNGLGCDYFHSVTVTRSVRECMARAMRFAVGDLLWVRETWTVDPLGGGRGGGLESFDLYELRYRADGARVELEYVGPIEDDPYVRYYDRRVGDWWPSIFMPKQFSRLTLEVTNVNVERLQDISREDAMAEGIEPDQIGRFNTIAWRNYAYGNHPFNCAIASFRSLWNSINGADAWDANPWVVALTFTVHKRNVHSMPQRVREVA